MKCSLIIYLMLVLFIVDIPKCTEIPPGNVSGNWYESGNPYNINGDIIVPEDSLLVIHQNVMIIFQGFFSFTVNGFLSATGNANDSIIFTAADTSYGWRGLRFINAPDSSYLSFCVVEYGRASGTTPNTFGGGIYCLNSIVSILNCRISNNHADYSGGGIALIQNSNSIISDCYIWSNTTNHWGSGIYVDDSNPVISGNIINGNATPGSGGGIYLKNSTGIIKDNTIRCNFSAFGGGIYCRESNLKIENNDIVNNCVIGNGGGIHVYRSYSGIIGNRIRENSACYWGGGVFCELSSPEIASNEIISNEADEGGGIYCFHASPLIIEDTIKGNVVNFCGGGILCFDSTVIENCIIIENEAGCEGGGIYCGEYSTPFLLNCTITRNRASSYGGGIMLNECSPIVVNTILERNTGIGAIFFSMNVNSTIMHCDFWGNRSEDFTGNVSPGLGIIDTVNLNHDPCDCFFNIFLDPFFVNSSGENYHLQSGSPCIDAGDPHLPYDPDSTIADMGAFFFDQSWVKDPREIPQSTEFRLSQNYPNPFNPTTIIPFQVPHASHITLSVYDVLGRKVVTLIDNPLSNGYHTAAFDASELSSGIYFCQLQANDFIEVKKMILLK